MRFSCAPAKATSRLDCKDRLQHTLVFSAYIDEARETVACHGSLPTCVPALAHQAGTDDVVSPHMGSAQDRGTLQSSDHS